MCHRKEFTFYLTLCTQGAGYVVFLSVFAAVTSYIVLLHVPQVVDYVAVRHLRILAVCVLLSRAVFNGEVYASMSYIDIRLLLLCHLLLSAAAMTVLFWAVFCL